MGTFGLFHTDAERYKAERIATLRFKAFEISKSVRRSAKGALRIQSAILRELNQLENPTKAQPQLHRKDRRHLPTRGNSSGGVNSLLYAPARSDEFLKQKRDYRLLCQFPKHPLPAPRSPRSLREQDEQIPHFKGNFGPDTFWPSTQNQNQNSKRSLRELREDVRIGKEIGWFQAEHSSAGEKKLLREGAKRDIALWKYNHSLQGSRDLNKNDRRIELNGKKTNKRRADTTEAELVASINEIGARANTKYTIERAGITTNDLADKIVDVHFEVKKMRIKETYAEDYPILKTRWFSVPLLFIMAQFHAAYAFVGEVLGSFVGVYRIAEIRENTHSGHSNKRQKISLLELEPARWIDPWTHGKLQDEVYAFYKFICIIFRGLDTYQDNVGIDYLLKPLRPLLDSATHSSLKKYRGGKPYMATWLSSALDTVWRVFDTIYDAETVSHLGSTHGTVENTFKYGFDQAHLRKIGEVQRLLMNPAFSQVMISLADALCAHDANMKHLPFPQRFLARGIMDLEAVLRGVPAPSYIISDDYEKNFLELFGQNINRASATAGNPFTTQLNPPPEDDEIKFPGAYPATPPRTPSPPPPKRLVTDTIPKDVVLQSPPSPIPRKSKLKEADGQAYDGPIIAADSYRYPDLHSYQRRYQHQRRDTKEARAIKTQHELGFTSRTPPRGEARKAKAGTGVLRKKHSPNAPAPNRVPRKVHFSANAISPPSGAGGNVSLSLSPNGFVPDRSRRADDWVEAADPHSSAFPPPLGDGEQADQPSASRRHEDVNHENLSSEHVHFDLWEQPTAEPTIPDPRSPVFRSPLSVERNRDSEELAERRLKITEKAKKFSLDEWFDKDEGKAREEGRLPSISSLRLSDDSKEEIRLHKAHQAKLRHEREEAKRLAEVEREAEEQRKLRADVIAKTGGLRLPEGELIGDITPEWQSQLDRTLRISPQVNQVLSRTGVELRKNEFERLLPPTEWLNDEVVNGALEWLDEAVNLAAGINDPKKKTRKCLVMTSLWYKSAKEKEFKGTARALRRQGVTKENILDVDTILVPICEGSHWTLLVVQPSQRKLAHIDSMNAAGSTNVTRLARIWMKDILEDKFIDEEWSIVRYEAPGQNNGYDCGVFAVANGICLALGLSPIYTYRSDQMALMRKRIGCVLLNQGFTGPFDLTKY